MAAGLECPICYELPEAHVHQCAEGHCFCAECDASIVNRLCPICREPLPAQRIRNLVMEQQIAALPATCSYCNIATTRGEKAAHELACAQRPRSCVASSAGCRWTGLVAVQPAHEETCPFVVCHRMMAPLRAQNEQLKMQVQPLRAENLRLRARVAALEPLQARVAALEPLQARVVALEGAGDDGGRRQRQRVGPAPHDPPPTDEAIAEMTLQEAVATLQTCVYVANARVAEKVCLQLKTLATAGKEKQVVDAGAIEAIVTAMQTHLLSKQVAVAASRALWNICYPQTRAILRRAEAAGAKPALQAAEATHGRRECWANLVLDMF